MPDIDKILETYGPVLMGYAVKIVGVLIALWIALRIASSVQTRITNGLRKKDFDETLAIFFGSISRWLIVIGAVLARNLKVTLDDELTFLGSGFDDSFAAGIVRVVGIFESGIPDLDRSMAQVDLAYFRDVFAMQRRGRRLREGAGRDSPRAGRT